MAHNQMQVNMYNQNIKHVRGPPEHSAIDYFNIRYGWYFVHVGIIVNNNMLFKTIAGGSHFWWYGTKTFMKIEKNGCQQLYQNYLVGFITET